MPLIVSAYLVFAGGLLIGLSRPGAVTGAILIAIGLSGILATHSARHRSRAALSVLFSGGVLLGTAESRAIPLRAERDQVHAAPSLFDKARARAARKIEAAFGRDAPLAKALLIADRQGIPPEMNDDFVAAGLVHILSISGLHVGIIAASIALLFQSMRFSQRASALAVVVTVSFYVGLLGWQPPALRAAVMVAAVTLGKFSQRPTSPWALLAIGAFIPLIQPGVVGNLGYQLSVAGMVALIASGAVGEKVFSKRLKGLRLKLSTEVCTSVIATVVTAPLTAWSFGRLSLIGPLSNIVATPIVGILQPLLFLALVLPVPTLARFAADASHPLLSALNATAHFFAGVPGAVIEVSPSWTATILSLVAVASLLVAAVSRYPTRALILSASCCAVAVVAPFPVFASGKLEMHVLDVGQGDAILLRSPAGRWILIDAGRAWQGGDAGRSVIIPYVRRRGGDVAAFILSHPHLDHVGGAATIVRALQPRDYWDAAFAGGSAAYRASLDAAARGNVNWHRVHPGDSTVLDGIVLNFLAPDSTWTAALPDANNASTVVMVTYGMVRFLLTGDAEQAEESWLIEHARTLRADVLKVGHHGSSTSSGDAFISLVCPQLALISVGAINSYGHPSGDVIAALRGFGSEVVRTDKEGTVVVQTDGKSIDVQTAEHHWEFLGHSSGSLPDAKSSCRGRSSSAIRSLRVPVFALADSRQDWGDGRSANHQSQR